MTIQYLFTDVRGFLMHVIRQGVESRAPARTALSGALMPGWQSEAESDLQLVADATTEIDDPFDNRQRLAFAQPVEPGEAIGSYPMDARGVARRIDGMLQSLGVADHVRIGTELEFNLLKGVRFTTTAERNLVEIAEEDAWAGNAEGLGSGFRIGHRTLHHLAGPADQHAAIRSRICEHLAAAGIEAIHHAHEAGPSQHEIALAHTHACRAADQVQLLKHLVRTVALQHERTATFMPRPIPYAESNGMHVNLSLWKDGRGPPWQLERHLNVACLSPAGAARVSLARRRAGSAGPPGCADMKTPHLPRPAVLLHACWVSALVLLLVAITLASLVHVEQVVRCEGEVRAREPGAQIVSPLSGRIRHVHVREGDAVRKGNPLLTFEPDVNGLSLQEARLNVNRWTASHAAYANLPPPVKDPDDPVSLVQTITYQGARNELQAAQSHLSAVAEQVAESLAQVDVEAATLQRQRALEPIVRERIQRHADLVRSGFQSPMSMLTVKQDLIDTEQQTVIAGKRLALAREAVKRSEAALEAARHDLDRLRTQRAAEAYAQMLQAKAAMQRLTELSGKSVIVSPVDGVIEHVERQVAGNAVRSDERLMSVVPDRTPMELQLRIRNEDYPFVKAGQSVNVKFEAYPFTIYGIQRADVVRVLREAMGSKDHLSSFVAIAQLHPLASDEVAFDIRPGMALRADIVVGRQRPIDLWLDPFIRFGREAFRDRR